MTDEYNKHVENVIEALDKAEDAIEDMIEFCSYGEPELFGSKAMKFFFQNLRDLSANGKSFLYERQDRFKYSKEKKK